MSEVRVDPLTGRAVVLCADRILPPPAFAPGTLPVVASCPFCPGQEHQTRQTLGQRPLEGEWEVRAFPNNRPALLPELQQRSFGDPLHQGVAGVGAHEVIVESRAHDEPSMADQVATLELAAERLEDLEGDPRFQASTWFRNRCAEAGSSQPHPHSQIVATPYVPWLLAEMAARQERLPGLLGELRDRAREAGRLVMQVGGVMAFTPWAPRAPLEVWIVPDQDLAQLWSAPALLPAVGEVLHHISCALDTASGRAAHNVVLYGAPLRREAPDFRWHIRVLPRLVRPGGFEGWAGDAMHPLLPEDAAAVLRGFVP